MTGERGLAEVLILGMVISSAMWIAAVIDSSADAGAERHAPRDDTEVASPHIDNVATCDGPVPTGDGAVGRG